MWSEIVFQNLKDASRALLPSRYTVKDIEYTLFAELKSDAYGGYLQGFVEKGAEYPRISIEICYPTRKMSLLKNSPVTYGPHENLITVCRNHVHSLQTLREAFARENLIVYDEKVK